MKGFITIRNAPVEKDNETYYVNIASIAFFHGMDPQIMKDVQRAMNNTTTVTEADMPRTMVYINAQDYDGCAVIFRIAETPEAFAARLEAASR